MRYFILTFLFSAVVVADLPVKSEPKYKIAIFDTGYNPIFATTKIKLCSTGHFDYKANKPGVGYSSLHGTLVASLIAERLKDVDYCAIIYQVQSKEGTFPDESLTRAITSAINLGVTAVNMSYQSYQTSNKERFALERLDASGAVVFMAAGNEGENLDYQCDEFPTCYHLHNFHPVGALDPDTGKHAKYSNHGKMIKLWYSGRTSDGVTEYNGTSFSAPRALAAFIFSVSKRDGAK